MKKKIATTFLAASMAIICACPPTSAAGPAASEIVRAVDSNLTFDEGVMNITMIDEKFSGRKKEFDMDVRYKKGAGTLIEFTSPARERGKKILMVEDNMWIYVPGLSRPVRLSGRDSFMGTSFSNRDLTDYDMSNDYKSEIVSESDTEYKIELNATNKNVSYQRILMWVEKSRLLPTKQELYTVSGNLIKTMRFTDIKDLGGKSRPSVITITDVMSRGNETRVVMTRMSEEKISERIFSPQNLAR